MTTLLITWAVCALVSGFIAYRNITSDGTLTLVNALAIVYILLAGPLGLIGHGLVALGWADRVLWRAKTAPAAEEGAS